MTDAKPLRQGNLARQGTSGGAERFDRLAGALRENLRKRKRQARERAMCGVEDTTENPGPRTAPPQA